MIRAILQWPDARLRMLCEPVTQGIDAAFIADLLETMYDGAGRGLAAPQVGVLQRIFVMDAGWKEGAPTPRVCINPAITPMGAKVFGPEACLSLPGVSTDVARAERTRMEWTDETGAHHREELSGFEAICAQHELDHLDGRLIFDYLSETARSDFLSAYSEA